jgi:cytoskeletal protein CcmA (bactofilin family)
MSVLGPDISISGQQLLIKTTGSLLIAGQVSGDIEGRNVDVGESGRVTGTIRAHIINIHGAAQGALIGSQVILHASARFEGEIIDQTLSIAEGAYFDGTVRRARDASEVTPNLT